MRDRDIDGAVSQWDSTSITRHKHGRPTACDRVSSRLQVAERDLNADGQLTALRDQGRDEAIATAYVRDCFSVRTTFDQSLDNTLGHSTVNPRTDGVTRLISLVTEVLAMVRICGRQLRLMLFGHSASIVRCFPLGLGPIPLVRLSSFILRISATYDLQDNGRRTSGTLLASSPDGNVMNRARVFDCFTFFDEFDILKSRLSWLSDVVDVWIVAQSTTTHHGAPKGIYLTPSHPLIVRFGAHRFRLAVFEDECSDPWGREKGQRMSLQNPLDQIARPGDVVLLSDVDEIPDRSSIREFKQSRHTISSLRMRHAFVYPNVTAGVEWLHAKAFRYPATQNLNQVRRTAVPPKVGGVGVHLSVKGHWSEAWNLKASRTLHSAELQPHRLLTTLDVSDCEQLAVLPRRDAITYLGVPKVFRPKRQSPTMTALAQALGMYVRPNHPPHAPYFLARRSLAGAMSGRLPGAPALPWRDWSIGWKTASFVLWCAYSPARVWQRARRFVAYRGFRRRLRLPLHLKKP